MTAILVSFKWFGMVANNSTPTRYLKNIPYSANIQGQIVGQIVAQYST